MPLRLPRPTPSTAVATLALVVASSAGAYAAGLAADSVGTRHLKDDAVNSSKIKDGTVKVGDLKPGVLPVDTRGAEAWITVTTSGEVLASENADGVTITHTPGTGTYCFSGGDFFVEYGAYSAEVYTPAGATAVVIPWQANCGADKLTVRMYDHEGDAYDAPFNIARL